MAQTAVSKKKEKEVIPPAFASITAADIIRAPVVERSVPLDLLPLLKPFKRAGRLSLRIERLPQRAKLSAGRRNSDSSWSLASDELSGLAYLVPSNAPAEHELTIRVMTFEDGAATTLKVIQHPIRLEESSDPAGNEDTICRSTETHDPVLRSQLGEMQSLFAVRESELAELRAAVQQAKSESATELQKARTAWEQDLNQRLAEVIARAESDRNQEGNARQAEQISQQRAKAEAQAEDKLAAERKRWQAETEQRLEAERQRWQAEAERRATTERERLASQAHQQIDAERKRWQAEIEQRIENERQSWQNQAEQRTAGERDRWTSQTGQHFETERKRWQAEAEQRVEAERQRWQTETAQRVEAERQKLQNESDQRFAMEQDRLRAESGQHLEAERQRWQAETAQRLENERQAWEPQADQRMASEQERWQAEARQQLETERQRWHVEADQRAAKERQTWQTQADQRLDHERKRHESESLAALKRAEESWKAQEAARAAAASAEWQQLSARILLEEKDKSAKLEVSLAVEADKSRKLEAALAHALVQAKSVPASGENGPALERIREELTAAKAALAMRETELVRNRAEREQEHNRWQQETQASLEARAAAWKAEEAVRLKAMAEMRAQSEDALAQMTERCESAEYALSEVRSKAASSQSHADDGYIESLRSEVAELRTALVKSETELGWARSALDQAQPLHIRRAAENLPIGMPFQQEQVEELDSTLSSKRTLVRDFLVVMAVVVPGILFYPWFAGYLPEGLRANLSSVTGGLLSTGPERSAAVPTATPAPAPLVQHPTIAIGRSLNVRATPSVKGAVVVSLEKGASLIVLEQSGNWTHVEVPAINQQGWVFSANLASKKETAKDDVALKDDTKDNVKDAAAPPAVSAPAAAPAVEPAAVDHSQVSPESQAPANPPPAPPPPESSPSP